MAGLLALAAGPAAARAASIVSSNWAGYVAHRPGVSFRTVAATWKEPRPACGTPFPGYSSTWVGLGGFRSATSALEQVGVELDCRAAGGPRSFAWYELVPAPAMRIGITINPGDTIRASVSVVGRRASLKLSDLTRHKTFTRTVSTPAVDVTSADWVVEAPSVCFRNNFCRTLPLADFGTVRFSAATATTTTRRRDSISSLLWSDTKITLLRSRGGYMFEGSAARAVPSPLAGDGSAFAVTSSRASSTTAPASPGPVGSATSVGVNQPGGPSR